jgi:hypothetical protein
MSSMSLVVHPHLMHAHVQVLFLPSKQYHETKTTTTGFLSTKQYETTTTTTDDLLQFVVHFL